MALTGQCLCGAVTLSAGDMRENFSACHCEMCQRWGSGPFLSAGARSIVFEGEDNIGRYRSSDWAERGFCRRCGTNLFYRLVEMDHYILGIGVFDDQARWKMTSQILTDEKPGHYDFANRTRMMTGPEVFEAFARGDLEE